MFWKKGNALRPFYMSAPRVSSQFTDRLYWFLCWKLWTHWWNSQFFQIPHAQTVSAGGICLWKRKSLGWALKLLRAAKKPLTKIITNVAHLHRVIWRWADTTHLWTVTKAILIIMKNNLGFARHRKSRVPRLELAFPRWQILNNKHS